MPRRSRTRSLRALVVSGAVLAVLGGAPSAGADVDHVVVEGEFLGAIAARYGSTVRELSSANRLSNPNLVRPGQRLLVPGVTPAPAAPVPAAPAPPAAQVPAADAGAAPTTAAPAPAAATPAAAAAPATTAAEVAHTVAAGEHLGSIAAQYGTTVRVLVSANQLRNPNVIRIGTVLKVPVSVPSRLPERLRQSPERLALRPAFLHWATEYGVPVDLLQATCWLESGWQADRVSTDGAVGICQVLPSTADHISTLIGTRLDPAVPEENIRLSARYLRWLLDRTGGDEGHALAGYVQGLRSVTERGRYGETEDYVDAIMALRSRFTV